MDIPDLMHQQDEQPQGAPAWMATFADLMSLLMCFFVLLLSYSEMDVLKFKQIAGSMKMAFGVQNKLEVKDIPKGTSIIAQEFSPGRPEPTPIENITQNTMEMTQSTLEFEKGDEAESGKQKDNEYEQRLEEENEATAALKKKIDTALEEHILDGAIDTESLGQQLVIRIRENGAFASGSAFLQPQFIPIVKKIAQLVSDVPGQIIVSGHTDDQSISGDMFQSNFDLSSRRAVAVAHTMATLDDYDPTRTSVVGHASNRPLVPNTTNANRRKNRRVEIAIMQGEAKLSDREYFLKQSK